MKKVFLNVDYMFHRIQAPNLLKGTLMCRFTAYPSALALNPWQSHCCRSCLVPACASRAVELETFQCTVPF